MALNQLQLQGIVDQTTSELVKIKQFINGDKTTTITLSDGSIIPSVNKFVYSFMSDITNKLQTGLQANLQLIVDDLLKNTHPVEFFQTTITSINTGTTIQITLDDMVAIKKFMINGLTEPNDGSVYFITNNTINVPPNDMLQANDVITVEYFTSNF